MFSHLEHLRESVKPHRVQEEIYDLLEQLFPLPHALPGQPEDVVQTLGVYTISSTDDSDSAALSIGQLSALW